MFKKAKLELSSLFLPTAVTVYTLPRVPAAEGLRTALLGSWLFTDPTGQRGVIWAASFGEGTG